MKSEEELNDLVKQAAHRVHAVFHLFDDLSPGMRQQAIHFTMQRVEQRMNGEKVNIEGQGLVTEIPETDQPENINTTETTSGENPEAV